MDSPVFHTTSYVLLDICVTCPPDRSYGLPWLSVIGAPSTQTRLARPTPNVTRSVPNWAATCVITLAEVLFPNGWKRAWTRNESPVCDDAARINSPSGLNS